MIGYSKKCKGVSIGFQEDSTSSNLIKLFNNPNTKFKECRNQRYKSKRGKKGASWFHPHLAGPMVPRRGDGWLLFALLERNKNKDLSGAFNVIYLKDNFIRY